MLLIAESDALAQALYKNYLVTMRLFEGLDYVFATSYRDAEQAFNSYEDQIDKMIVNHNLIGEETGADLIFSVVRNERNNIHIVRCSEQRLAQFYPPNILWFCRFDGIRLAVDAVLERTCY